MFVECGECVEMGNCGFGDKRSGTSGATRLQFQFLVSVFDDVFVGVRFVLVNL